MKLHELIKKTSKCIIPKWISVEKSLPKKKEWVLGYDILAEKFIIMRRINKSDWQVGNQVGIFSITDVSHWMPLPK
jgi:hypothetical protein